MPFWLQFVLVWIFLASLWNFWCFLNLDVSFLPQVKEVFHYYIFIKFLYPFLSLFFFSTLIMQMLVLLMLSLRSFKLSSFLKILFSFLLFSLVISTTLSSRLMIHCSVSSNRLLISSTVSLQLVYFLVLSDSSSHFWKIWLYFPFFFQVWWAYLWFLPWTLYWVDCLASPHLVLPLKLCLFPSFRRYSSVSSFCPVLFISRQRSIGCINWC